MIRILYNPVASVFLYPIRFYSSTTQLLPARSTSVHACFLQYKGIRLYTDVKVRNKVEEHRILTYFTIPQTIESDMRHTAAPTRLRPIRGSTRGPDGQWFDPPPEPEPPDPPDASSEGWLAGSVDYDRAPVTTGGLILRGPSPRPRPQVTRLRPQVAPAAEPPITRR